MLEGEALMWSLILGMAVLLGCGQLAQMLFDKEGPGFWWSNSILIVGAAVGSWFMWPVFSSMPYYGLLLSLGILCAGAIVSVFVAASLAKQTYDGRSYTVSPSMLQFFWGYITTIFLALFSGNVIANAWPGNVQQIAGVIIVAIVGYGVHFVTAIFMDMILTPDYPGP